MAVGQIISQTGSGTSGMVVFDEFPTVFNVSIGCVASGTVSYTIQHSFDNPQVPASMTWFPHDNSDLVAATGNANDNYAYIVRAARILNTGSGTITATFRQSGLGRW
jgi:hypothetical protein